MKRLKHLLATILIAVLCVGAAVPTYASPTAASSRPTQKYIHLRSPASNYKRTYVIGDRITLRPKVGGQLLTRAKAKYRSSNSRVVSVTNTGVLRIKKKGTRDTRIC